MFSLLLLLACGRGERSKIIEPGDGPSPAQALMPLDVGNRVYGTVGNRILGARLEHPVRDGGRVIHRWVTDDDTYLFEQDGDDLLWWGSMTQGGRFERPLLLAPADLKDGMIWEARDGSGGVTHLISASRRPDQGFQNAGGPQEGGRSFTAWGITVEEVTGAYEPLNTLRSTGFLFYEGVGLVEVSIRGQWNEAEGFLSYGTGPVDHASVTRGGAEVAALDGPSLQLQSTPVTIDGTVEQLAARTADNGDTQVFVPFQTKEIVDSTVGGQSYAITTNRAGRCFTWSGGGFREENGCPMSFGATPGAAIAEGELEIPGGVLGAVNPFESSVWFPDLVGGFWGSTSTYGYGTGTRDDATVIFRNDALVWSQAALEEGSPAWPYEFGFAKAGIPDLHDLGDDDYEALIVDADGPVWRIVPGGGGPTLELLGIVDLPEGHWLTGAARVASSTVAGSTLLVSTTTGRFEPLRSPDVVPDPSVSSLWTTTLGAPTTPDRVTTDIGVIVTEAGFTGCSLQGQAVEGLRLGGVDGASRVTSPAFGELPCAVVDTDVDIPRSFPTDARISFASGAETELLTNATNLTQAEITLATFSSMLWTSDTGALSREHRYNEALLPMGPGADAEVSADVEIVVDHVTGQAFDAAAVSADGTVRAAGGGGVYGVSLVADGLAVHWTDGTTDWERSFSGPVRDALAWADGRVCVLGVATAQCEGSDGVLREAPLVGLTAAELDLFVTPSHGLRITQQGAFTIDPETAESVLLASFSPTEFYDPLQTQAGDVWLFVEDNVSVQLSGSQATFYAAPEVDDPSFTQRLAVSTPVVIDGHLHTSLGVFEGERLVQAIYRYPLVPLAEPPHPPVQELPPGTRVGDVTVGDVASPGADVVPGGTTPDLQPTSLVHTTVDGIVYGGNGWVSLREGGPVPLGFDGVDGSPGTWPGIPQLFGTPDNCSSPGGDFVWMQGLTTAWRIQPEPLVVDGFDFSGFGSVGRRVSDLAADGTGVFVSDYLANGDLVMGTVDGAGLLSTELELSLSTVQSISIARGGRLVAATTGVEHIGLYEASTGDWVADLHSTGPAVREVAFDPTGSWLALQTNTTLELWAVQAGLPQDAFVRVGSVSTLAREQLSWSPNGDRLIGMTPSTLEIFDITPSGPVLHETIDLGAAFVAQGGVLGNGASTVAWKADGSELTFVDGTGSLLRLTP